MRTRNRSTLLLLVLLAVGLIIGGIIGDLLSDTVPLLERSYPIGLEQPIHLDLNVIDVTFGFMIDINLASVLGLIISILIFRKL